MLVRVLPKFNIFEPFLWVFYVWYYFPIARAFFRSTTYNMIFFGIFGCGCLLCLIQLLCNNLKLEVKFTPLVPVLIFMAVFTVMSAFGVGDAGLHVRVSFMFWGSLIVFYLSGYFPNARKRLAVLLLVLFLITIFTSVLGVAANPRVARTLAYAANDINEDLAIRMLNIGGIAFFQGLVICVPILVTFIFKKKYVAFSAIMLTTIFIGVLSASFTITLLLFFVAIVFSYMFNRNSIQQILLLVAIFAIILIVPWDKLFYYLSGLIDNDTVSQRFDSIASTLSNNAMSGNLKSRFDLYWSSLKVFFNSPLGIGPKYSYVAYENGIGYHSQVLDDLARYGLFAATFYVSFFVGYFKLVKKQWAKIEMQQIAAPVVILYVLFLILNPGLSSAHESVLMLLIIPILPELISLKSSGFFSFKKK